jgi:hypothetical protein
MGATNSCSKPAWGVIGDFSEASWEVFADFSKALRKPFVSPLLHCYTVQHESVVVLEFKSILQEEK